MWLAFALLACGETAPTPVPEDPPVASPVEPETPPVGSIGGEPILPSPTVVGAISADAVDAGIRERMSGIEHCYAVQRDEHPDLAGKVLVKFVISKDGTVRSASTKSTSLRDGATEKCVLDQVAMARFPPLSSGALAIVHYPFVFPPP
jgi:hypothetical protein